MKSTAATSPRLSQPTFTGPTTISGAFFQSEDANLISCHTNIIRISLPISISIEDGHVIPGLIHKCYLAKKNGAALIIIHHKTTISHKFNPFTSMV